MAKEETAKSKKAKISEAQQYMLLAVLGATVFLGAAISIVLHCIKEIGFNADIIIAEDKAIVVYSDTIENIGICKKPKGKVYSLDELKQCDPDSVTVSEVPGTLRANIVEGMAENSALNSVPKENTSGCIDPDTGRNYTYAKMNQMYNEAGDNTERNAATSLIRQCSALRIIPDALPAYKNEEALLASLNKIFIESDWQPESISPSNNFSANTTGINLNGIGVNLSIESTMDVVMGVINNIERSIRTFNIGKANIEWNGENNLSFSAQATAYYMDKTTLVEVVNNIKGGTK